MKNLLRYALPATVAVTMLSFIPLLSVRVIWADMLLLSTGLAGAAAITFIILRKTQILNIQEKFLKDRQNFELLVGSIRDYAIFLLDINGRVASWNRGAESIKGFTSVDIIGKPTDLFYKDEDIENGLPQRNLQLALQLGHFETEGWRLRKDRSPFYADVAFTPLYDQQHKHYGYAVVTRDITRRKETEAALVTLNNELEVRVIQKTAERIASEEKLSTGEAQFRHTLDNMLEGIQIHDRAWRYVYVNRALVKYAHYSSSELLGFTLMEKYPGIEQTDLFATLQRCMNERLALLFETEFVFPNGIKKDFQLSIQPVPEGLFILSIDITERKIAEGLLESRLAEKKVVAARMQSILDTIPADIALLNDKGIIIDVNDAWRNGTGSNGFTGNAYKTGDNYLDRSKHVSDEQWKEREEVAKGLADVLSNKVNEFVHEYDCDDPEIKKCFRMVARPLLGKESAGAVVIHIDITELRRLERETLAGKIEQQKSITRAMLQAQEKERNHIGLELHDNVSQLLAATRMKLQLAVKGREVNKAVIIECITHVEETMVETRNLSHRMVMPRFADSSFLEAIEGLAVIYRMPSRTIHLETGGLDEKIVSPGIKETLYRIAQEQLNNINKYAQATAILIRTTTNNDTVTMLVKDNGVGFNTMKKKAGIGLVNIKNRSESYNGSAVIASTPGNGCSLTIHIPLQNPLLVPCDDALPALIK